MSPQELRALVEALCSDRCDGRRPGTKGAEAARGVIREALAEAGLEPEVQQIPSGENLFAGFPGQSDRVILVAAHYDHLGRHGAEVYRGADDNAAAVAIVVALAKAFAKRGPQGRGVLLAFFDAEEPPYFLSGAMGSEHFARNPLVPLDRIDLMVCMDLVGHALGSEGMPQALRDTLFALGAERATGVAEHVDRLGSEEDGVVVRRLDAELIPPLSDYDAFWKRQVPFLFLTCGRWRHYHTPEDTPEKLAWGKIAATARWLERFVRERCLAETPRFIERSDDAATLRTLDAVLATVAHASPVAAGARLAVQKLLARCDAAGALTPAAKQELQMLALSIEATLA